MLNAIKGRHISRGKDGKLSANPKQYIWYIPESMSKQRFRIGDLVWVENASKFDPKKTIKGLVQVTDVYYEDDQVKRKFIIGFYKRFTNVGPIPIKKNPKRHGQRPRDVVEHDSIERGYVDLSRSVQSKEAIEKFEVPLTHITKSLITDFMDVAQDKYFRNSDKDWMVLLEVPVRLWRFVAEEIGPSSWHHTGCCFNKTNHYKLKYVAQALLEDGVDKWESEYQMKVGEKEV